MKLRNFATRTLSTAFKSCLSWLIFVGGLLFACPVVHAARAWGISDTTCVFEEVRIVHPELRKLIEDIIIPIADENLDGPYASEIHIENSEINSENLLIIWDRCSIKKEGKMLSKEWTIPVYCLNQPSNIAERSGKKVSQKFEVPGLFDLCENGTGWVCSLKNGFEVSKVIDWSGVIDDKYTDRALLLPKQRKMDALLRGLYGDSYDGNPRLLAPPTSCRDERKALNLQLKFKNEL